MNLDHQLQIGQKQSLSLIIGKRTPPFEPLGQKLLSNQISASDLVGFSFYSSFKTGSFAEICLVSLTKKQSAENETQLDAERIWNMKLERKNKKIKIVRNNWFKVKMRLV